MTTVEATPKIAELQKALDETEAELEAAQERIEELEADCMYLNARIAEIEGLTLRLQRYVWLNDKPGKGVYCRECGRGYPIHRHDCPFIEVE